MPRAGLPDDSASILEVWSVRRQDGHFVHQGIGGDHSVEGVPMDGGKPNQGSLTPAMLQVIFPDLTTDHLRLYFTPFALGVNSAYRSSSWHEGLRKGRSAMPLSSQKALPPFGLKPPRSLRRIFPDAWFRFRHSPDPRSSGFESAPPSFHVPTLS
jgi:hypothetical protein